jgi:lipoprotein-anchoring transpeptidase ErfK/SrfK
MNLPPVRLIDNNGYENGMIKRRDLILSGAAFGLLNAGKVVAHTAPHFVMPEDYNPTIVEMENLLPAGQIYVFPNIFRLFLTLPDQRAIRYTVGVGRQGLYHDGSFTIGAKRKWPSWTPTPAMIRRDPETYEGYADGMPGGIDNPLGARAMYLFDENGRDTYLRIHGTNAPRTIGTAVSNGCARLTNDHAKILYEQVAIGARVELYPQF